MGNSEQLEERYISSTSSSTVRTQWNFELASACQRFACDVLDPDPDRLTHAVHVLGSRVPTPQFQAETFTLRDRLLAATQSAAHQFHRQFHRVIPPRSHCGWTFRPPAHNWHDFDVRPTDLLKEWAFSYLQEFARTHEWPSSIRAARIIRNSFDKPFNVEQIARAAGCARSGLIRSFRDAFGMTMGDYHARCRIRPAVAMLRAPASKVAAASLDVGYHSPKNFYRALRELTGLTPAQVRRLSDEDATALLNTVLSLPSPLFHLGGSSRVQG